jgi:transposase-like protein
MLTEPAALLAEVEAEGGKVKLVARRHRMSESLLYNWRSAWKAAAANRSKRPDANPATDVQAAVTVIGRREQHKNGGPDLPDLNGAQLQKAILIDAGLSGANLIGVNLSGATLIGANLNKATLVNTDLSHTDLSGAHLRDLSNFTSIKILNNGSGAIGWFAFGRINLNRAQLFFAYNPRWCRDTACQAGCRATSSSARLCTPSLA